VKGKVPESPSSTLSETPVPIDAASTNPSPSPLSPSPAVPVSSLQTSTSPFPTNQTLTHPLGTNQTVANATSQSVEAEKEGAHPRNSTIPYTEPDQIAFVQGYRKAYRADPPSLLVENWLPFAASQQCLIHSPVYDKIRQELSPFRQIIRQSASREEGLLILKTLLMAAEEEAKKAPGRFSILRIEGGKITAPMKKRGTMERIVYPIASLLPENLTTIWNLMDEPKVVLGPSGVSNQNATSLFARLGLELPSDLPSSDPSPPPFRLRGSSKASQAKEKKRQEFEKMKQAEKDEKEPFKTLTRPASVQISRHPSVIVQNNEFLKRKCENDPNFPKLSHLHGFPLWGASPAFTDLPMPIFSQSKAKICGFADLTVPSDYYVDAAKVLSDDAKDAERASQREAKMLPWREKKRSVFWRGSTTGNKFDRKMESAGALGESHRIRLVTFANDRNANEHYQITDVAIAKGGVIQCTGGVCEKLKQKLTIRDKVPMDVMFTHMMLVDVDGNSFSRRITDFWSKSVSVVLKIQGLFNDWFDGLMTPWVDYVPISLDFSDWNRNIKWVLDHQVEAKRIAENGHKRAVAHLRLEDMQCFLLRLLLEFDALFNGKGGEEQDEGDEESIPQEGGRGAESVALERQNETESVGTKAEEGAQSGPSRPEQGASPVPPVAGEDRSQEGGRGRILLKLPVEQSGLIERGSTSEVQAGQEGKAGFEKASTPLPHPESSKRSRAGGGGFSPASLNRLAARVFRPLLAPIWPHISFN